MERNHLEQLLRANSLTPAASDDEVISMLLAASYTKDEAIRALATLRSNEDDKKPSPSVSNQKLFRSGERLNAGEISQLLGIDVKVNETIITKPEKTSYTVPQMVTVFVLSTLIAGTAVLVYMYIYDMGMFHPMMAQGN